MSDQQSSSMRTPLSRVRGLGASGAGTDHFWHQRLTALANIPLTIAALIVAISLIGKTHAEALRIVSQPMIAILLALFIVSITTHMRIGLQVVIEDYVHVKAAKILCVAVNIFFSMAVAAISLFAIFKIAVS
jgi:succinate dehydrogenase / fumarate reductase, membrane anchor subunit